MDASESRCWCARACIRQLSQIGSLALGTRYGTNINHYSIFFSHELPSAEVRWKAHDTTAAAIVRCLPIVGGIKPPIFLLAAQRALFNLYYTL